MKLPKDSRQTVRYNGELYAKLKDNGWTIQKLLDWAIEQNSAVEAKIEAKPVPQMKKVKGVK